MSVESKLENIASIDNLYMSWSRLINSISYSDVWYDEYLLRKFEYNLDENIKLIHERLLNGTYELKDIRPIPFPKGGLDEAGKPKVRQAFLIDIADQLVWIAVCNILGPITEVRMPAWSTGNRLYVPMWKEDNKWHCGSFMSSSSNIYRRWGQSWPKYRKSLTASIERLALGSYKKDSDTSEEKDILDDTDIVEIEDQQNGAMPDWMRICYLNDGYFKRTTYKDTLYWCSIDLAKYYPSIRLDYLKEMLYKYCSISEDKKVSDLISRLLDFKVNYEGYSDDELTAMNLKDKTFSALPTGLIVGGWLANVYLLDLDTSTDKKIKNNNGIIHFRYVDDHTFVSDDFDCLLDWVSEYVAELKNLKLVVNEDKIQPKIPEAPGFVFQNRILTGKEYIHSEPFKIRFQEKYGGDRVGSDLYTEFEKIKNFIRIDPQYPSPLMTLTLQKVSQISHLSLRLMSPNETDMVFHDLKSLISIDLPDAEIKKDTRISFASTMLSRLIVTDSIDLKSMYTCRRAFIDSCSDYIKKYKGSLSTEIDSVGNPKEGHCLSACEKIESEIGRICCAVFDVELDSCDSVASKENIEKFKDLDWQSLRHFFEIRYDSEKEVKKRAIKVYRLLLQAIKEMPDKVNIWIRTLEFCIKHLPEKVNYLFRELWRLSENGFIHQLAASFIFRQMVSLLSIRIVKAVWKYHSETDRDKRRYYDRLFSIITGDLYDNKKDYGANSFYNRGRVELFKLTKAFTEAHIRGNCDDLKTFLSDSPKEANFYILWILQSAPDYVPSTEILGFVRIIKELITPNDLYFNFLAFKIIKECKRCGVNYKEILDRHIGECRSEKIASVYKIADDEDDDYRISKNGTVSIRDWFRLINDSCLKTELASTVIFNAICKYVYDKAESLGDSTISLASIHIKICEDNNCAVEKTDNTSIKDSEKLSAYKIPVSWNEILNSSYAPEIFYCQDGISPIFQDMFSTPHLEGSCNLDSRKMFQLGVIYYHLLAGEYHDDFECLVRSRNYKWQQRINDLERNGKISSITKDILRGCLLPNSWEHRRLDGTIAPMAKKYYIKNLNELLKKLNTAEEFLRKSLVIGRLNNKDGDNDILNCVELKIIKA